MSDSQGVKGEPDPDAFRRRVESTIRDQSARMDRYLATHLLGICTEARRRNVASVGLAMSEVDLLAAGLVDEVLAALDSEVRSYPNPDELVRAAHQGGQAAIISQIWSWADIAREADAKGNPSDPNLWAVMLYADQIRGNAGRQFAAGLKRILDEEKARRMASQQSQP